MPTLIFKVNLGMLYETQQQSDQLQPSKQRRDVYIHADVHAYIYGFKL